jgi:hypothetical protein
VAEREEGREADRDGEKRGTEEEVKIGKESEGGGGGGEEDGARKGGKAEGREKGRRR